MYLPIRVSVTPGIKRPEPATSGTFAFGAFTTAPAAVPSAGVNGPSPFRSVEREFDRDLARDLAWRGGEGEPERERFDIVVSWWSGGE